MFDEKTVLGERSEVTLSPTYGRNHTRFSCQRPAGFEDVIAEAMIAEGPSARKMSTDALVAHIAWQFRVVTPKIIWSQLDEFIEPSEATAGIGIANEWHVSIVVPCHDPSGMLRTIQRDPDLDPELGWTEDDCLVISKTLVAGQRLEARERFEHTLDRFRRGLLDLERDIECYHQALPHFIRRAILRADLNARGLLRLKQVMGQTEDERSAYY